MALCCVVVEVREAIGCANVFLKLAMYAHITLDSLKFRVDGDRVLWGDPISMRDYGQLSLGQFFHIVSGSLRNLMLDDKFGVVSFRLSIQDIQKTVFDLDKFFIGLDLKPNILEQIKDKVSEETKENTKLVSFHCKLCESVICPMKNYKRVCPYPSRCTNFEELFCHHGNQFMGTIVPSIDNVLYGFDFVILNRNALENVLNMTSNYIKCQQCMVPLGEIVSDGQSVKLWNQTVLLKSPDNDYQSVFPNIQSRVTNVQRLLFKLIQESTLVSSSSSLNKKNFINIMLESCYPNGLRKFLLIQIVEYHLQVLRFIKNCEHIRSPSTATKNDVALYYAIKFFYKDIERMNDDDRNKVTINEIDENFLNRWRYDANTQYRQISTYLHCELRNEFDLNSQLIPEVFRFNKDQFSLSYVFYN